MKALRWVLFFAMFGCRPTVHLQLPPVPAVALHTDTVAVVARDRPCQASADALALELTKSSYLTVDPRSSLRVELLACGDDHALTVTVEAQDKAVRLEARAHAVVVVSDGGRVLAHLIGTGREVASFQTSLPLLRMQRQVQHRVRADLARDVVRQLNPLPTLVERRVYPNAPEGTARELVTLAVRAEQQGDLTGALSLAQAAWLRDPTAKIAGYIEELKRRRTPLPAPIPAPVPD